MKRDIRSKVMVLWLLAALVALPALAGERRALLIGIDDYSAEGLEPAAGQETAAGRSAWPDLYGAVNDATAMRGMLIARYGFEARNVRLLIDQEATRAAILAAIDRHLIKPSGTGDHAVFFFAGHGSQVVNSKSDEPDGMDETRVPADSRRGARDIRDKELRGKFNRILDRGARLTVIFDSCHSGSGSKGEPRRRSARRLEPDTRDVADGRDYGPAPESRGALVLAAAQDFQLAWETSDDQEQDRGAFSLVLLRAMRAAGPRESAEHVFQRAEAAIRLEAAPQDPVLAGDAGARAAPLFGGRADHRSGKTVVAVRHVAGDGAVAIRGGWANGLTVGSELRPFGDAAGDPGLKLRVNAIEGLSSSTARIPDADRTLAATVIEPGDLLELSGWASPRGQPLRVWIPEAGEAAASLARQLEQRARRAGIGWVVDPVAETPSHVLSWRRGSWCLLGAGDGCADLGAAPDAETVIDRLAVAGSRVRLFVHLPAAPGLARDLAIGPGTGRDAVEATADPRRADYDLVGRLHRGRIEYAWVRPLAAQAGAARSPLPLRSDWLPVADPVPPSAGTGRPTAAVELKIAVLRLAKLRAWLALESPAGDFPYRLALQAEDGSHRTGGILKQGERYGLVLRAGDGAPECCVVPRYTYVFALDGFGESVLWFPLAVQGSVENRFPLEGAGGSLPTEIDLGPSPPFDVGPHYGKDTYFLLTSEEPIPNPWVVEQRAVRSRGADDATALERLLSLVGGARRSDPPVTAVTWSIERLSFDSVAGAAP